MEKQQTENIGLRPIIVDYLRHWKLIAVTGVISLILAILYLLLFPKTYETMARVQIQEDDNMLSSGSIGLGEAAGVMKSFGLGGFASGSINIDDEIVTFYSSYLMSEAISKLGLYVEYTKPPVFWYKMYGEEPVKVTCDPSALASLNETIKFYISSSGAGVIKIKYKTLKESKQLQFESFPAEIEVNNIRFVINKNPASSESSFSVKAAVNPPHWVAEALAKEMVIEDYSKTSNMIEFMYQDHQAQRAKDILNTIIAYYNEDAFSYKQKVGQASLDFLAGRISNVTGELSLVEKQIERYKTANKLTDVEYDIQYYAEYMRELKVKMIELETQSVLFELMDDYIKNPDNKYAPIPSMFTTLTEMEATPVSLYNMKLIERERTIQNSSPDNPLVTNLNLEIERLRESVFRMIDNAHQSMVLARKRLEDTEQQLIKRQEAVPEQERVYVDLKRQQEIYQGVYLILLQKREEIALSIGQNVDKAKVIDAAFVMKKPVQPRKLFAAIGLIVLTLALSIGWLFFKDQTVAIWKQLREEKVE
ncbi:MAG: tyrosine protein kinase [Tannerella sp.]|jgi:uncharacterized protein involved in exopolysaccharide biosynthesis|nr:tyrosine protein kinase [Tannerella sp.]